MIRDIEKEIEAWISSGNNALAILGARQVGKTYSISKVLRESKVSYVQLDLAISVNESELLKKANTVNDFIKSLQFIFPSNLSNGSIVFIDECQNAINIFTLIKYLVIDNRYRYILSGSFLGNFLSDIRSVPVGYLNIINMYPMSFKEFLININLSSYIDIVRESLYSLKEVPKYIHDILNKKMKEYMIVGGMPQVVYDYINHNDYNRVKDIQKYLIGLYEIDFSKYNIIKKPTLKALFHSIPQFLLKSDNKKFILSNIDNNTNYERIKSNLDWLKESGYILYSHMNKNPQNGLALYLDNSFKMYYFDVGILTYLLGHEYTLKFLADSNTINTGGLYENFVATELTKSNIPLIYYFNKKAGEVEFIIESKGIIPVEVKSGTDYMKHSALTNIINNRNYDIKRAYVLCDSNIKTINKITYLPTYSIIILKELLRKN